MRNTVILNLADKWTFYFDIFGRNCTWNHPLLTMMELSLSLYKEIQDTVDSFFIL